MLESTYANTAVLPEEQEAEEFALKEVQTTALVEIAEHLQDFRTSSIALMKIAEALTNMAELLLEARNENREGR